MFKLKESVFFFFYSKYASIVNAQFGISIIGTGTSFKENFQTGFVVSGGGFLSYWNHQLNKFEEEKRFGI